MLLAEIITIGDELLIGQTVDTNSAWMAKVLNLNGIKLHQITSVSDEREHILQALNDSSKRAKIVLITGGLGPTKDDITKSTLCEYFNTKLEMNAEVLESIENFFKQFDRPMLDSNRNQALLPKACEVLINTRGTASGMWFEKEGVVYVSMPGVPYEMKGLMTDEVIARLKYRFETPAIYHKTLLTQGIGESFLAEQIRQWEDSLAARDLKLAYLPSPGMVKLRISAYGHDELELREKVLLAASELRSQISDFVFGEDEQSMESIIGELLKSKNKTLALAESCTGGNISRILTAIPGSSQYFLGCAVTYSNASKVDILGAKSESLTEYGAVSKAVVEEMAVGSKRNFHSDYALATSGVAGPEGGTVEKPVGLVWIALAGPNGVVSEKFNFGNNRDRNIQRASIMALDMLRKELLK